MRVFAESTSGGGPCVNDRVVLDFKGPSGTRFHVGTATYRSKPITSILNRTSGKFSRRKPNQTCGCGSDCRYVVLRVECH